MDGAAYQPSTPSPNGLARDLSLQSMRAAAARINDDAHHARRHARSRRSAHPGSGLSRHRWARRGLWGAETVMDFSRRSMLAGAGGHSWLRSVKASGPFEANWDSDLALSHARLPTPSSASGPIGAARVPEFGDWYGRLMYVQGSPFYARTRDLWHRARWALLIIGRWRAEAFDPEALLDLYQAAVHRLHGEPSR